MRGYSEKEKSCDATFNQAGPYWHAYTSGKETPVLFVTDEDLQFVMNVIAQAAFEHKSCVLIITFQVLNNHFHFVASGMPEGVRAFYAFIKKRLARSFPAIRHVELQMKQIDSLNSLRNNIVYTNRNGFVSNERYTPFSYPWGGGRYYYNDIPTQTQYSDIFTDARRQMFRGRDPKLPDNWVLIDNYVAPISYCAIRFGMALFRDAHHYFSAVSKDIEAYGEIARDTDEGEFMTDAELFKRLTAHVRKQFALESIRDMSKAQKLDIARAMHFDYRCSNGQIRRVLGLSQYEVDMLFPLKAKC